MTPKPILQKAWTKINVEVQEVPEDYFEGGDNLSPGKKNNVRSNASAPTPANIAKS